MAKEIRFNVPKKHDREEYGSEENLTLHADGVTVFFDEFTEHRGGACTFKKDGVRVAYVSEDECDVSPGAAVKHARCHPGEKVRFAD